MLVFQVGCVGRGRALVLLGALLAATTAVSASAGPNPAPSGPLMTGPTRSRPAWLGVTMQPVASAGGASGGVFAAQVTPGSPAERVGIRAGDTLKRVAGVAVSSPVDVQRSVAARVAGDVLVVVVDRGGREVTFNVELSERPTPDAIARATYVGKLAPSLVGLATVNGPPLTTEGLKNRVVILDFWAVWCVPCRLSLPALSSLQARYGAQGLTVLSITTDPAENAATFARELGLRTSIIVDPQGSTSQAYGVNVLPTTFVLDRRGVVRDVTLGYERAHDARTEALVRALLAEPAVASTPTTPHPAPSSNPASPPSSALPPSAPSTDAGADARPRPSRDGG